MRIKINLLKFYFQDITSCWIINQISSINEFNKKLCIHMTQLEKMHHHTFHPFKVFKVSEKS